MNPARMFLAKKLREWRKARGLPLKRVSQDFGVSEATWHRWERGSRFPAPQNLRLLSEFIGAPICDFFYADEQACPLCPRPKTRRKEQ